MMSTYTKRQLILASSAVVCGFQVVPSLAQPSSGSSMLEEIVVTARRREESLQDVPIAVSALSGEALTQSGIRNAVDLQTRVPGLNITNQGDRNSVAFAIRGQRTNEFQLLTDPPVGTYFAEVVQPR